MESYIIMITLGIICSWSFNKKLIKKKRTSKVKVCVFYLYPLIFFVDMMWKNEWNSDIEMIILAVFVISMVLVRVTGLKTIENMDIGAMNKYNNLVAVVFVVATSLYIIIRLKLQ